LVFDAFPLASLSDWAINELMNNRTYIDKIVLCKIATLTFCTIFNPFGRWTDTPVQLPLFHRFWNETKHHFVVNVASNLYVFRVAVMTRMRMDQ
jgi:hypothetical protein